MQSSNSFLKPGLFDLWRRVVAVHGGEVLAFLGENPVAMQIAIEPEIAEDVEGVIDVLEGAAELVAAVPALGKMFCENLPPLRRSSLLRFGVAAPVDGAR